MLSTTATLPLLLAGFVAATPCGASSIKWGRCEDIVANSSLPYECATHEVPLDWTAPGNSTIKLQLIKVPASQQPSKGSVQFNFGGPGFENRNALLGEAERLLFSTGGIYDLIAFDPRGTANTIPFDCSDSPSELSTLYSFYQPTNYNDRSAVQDWAFADALAGRCWHKAKDVGPYIGTAFGARDMMSIVDALEEDGKLRYWGFSYGTTLGATVSAMFPDRVDKVVLDGNQNIHEYYYGHGEIEQWTDADKLFSSIWSTCIEAGASLCPLAAKYNDSTLLENDVWTLIDGLKEQPLAISSQNVSVVLDHVSVLGLAVANAFAGIATWPLAAQFVNLLLEGDMESEELVALVAAFWPEVDASAINVGTTRTIAIRGADRFDRATDLTELWATIAEQEALSRTVGSTAASLTIATSRWRFDAKERYEGGWENIRTSHPLLVIGNTFDGQTALQCAHNTSAIFDESVVLEVQAYGHTSLAGVSACSDAAVSAYFVNGTLPAEGTVCPIDVLPYGMTAAESN